jgi:DnaJ-class molecular chaperone
MCRHVDECQHEKVTCPRCDGAGLWSPFFSDFDMTCRTCNGDGYVCKRRATAWYRLLRWVEEKRGGTSDA